MEVKASCLYGNIVAGFDRSTDEVYEDDACDGNDVAVVLSPEAL